MTSKDEALTAIAEGIYACFGSVDLKFALHQSEQNQAKALRKIARD